MKLQAERLTVRLDGRELVKDVSFTLTDGQWLMLCGPNGAGKTTLVRAVSRAIPSEGALWLDGADLRRMKPGALARRIGVLSQHSEAAYAFTVEEVVALGRYAWRGGAMGRGDPEGPEKVEEALRLTGLADKRRQTMPTLSGGERQRTFLAQVLCQDPSVMILDEPANHLDLRYQRELLELIDRWRREEGRAVISVMHDLSLARRYGTHALLMDGGRAVSVGACREALGWDNLCRVWGEDVCEWMRRTGASWEEDHDGLCRA